MPIHDFYRKDPLTINSTATIREALQKMTDESSNGLIIVHNKKVLGILSLQDIAGAIVPDDIKNNVSLAEALYKEGYFEEIAKTIVEKKVTEIMRREFITISPDSNIMQIAAEFLQNDLYIIPVVKHNELVGVVTRSEMKKGLEKAMGLSS